MATTEESPNSIIELADIREYLDRETADDENVLIDSMNAAIGVMEQRTQRRLRERAYYEQVTIGGLAITANLKTVTGSGLGALTPGLDVLHASLRTGTRIATVDSGSQVTLTKPALTAAAGASVVFGSSPMELDGDGTQEIVIPEWPVESVGSAKWLDGDGAKTTLDATGARLDKIAGIYRLSREVFPLGRMNVQVQCKAGYRAPTATDIGHPEEWARLRKLQHRITQIVWQDFRHKLGRTAEVSLGGQTIRFTDLSLPKDVAEELDDFSRKEV